MSPKLKRDMNTQRALELGGDPTAGEVLDRIRETSRDASEKGRWFEQLFMRVARKLPELEIDEIWRWAEWPERQPLTELDGRDIGIDLVARRRTGEWVAIQCKCYAPNRRIGKGQVDKFLGASQNPVFGLRWIVATCRWGPHAESAIRRAHPQVSQIDFGKYHHVQIREREAARPIQKPWPLQQEAIEDVVEGLGNHDRGRLVMACGTGKTFTSLRIAEEVVPDGGRILFAAPSIALVSQARREWLRHTTRKLRCVVVCSDHTAGGRNETEDMRVSELECPVSTDPSEIAEGLSDDSATPVVFCTYHSLGKVTQAQSEHGAPEFDLAIADEAHRTTGILRQSKEDRKVDFQEFHDEKRLRTKKRLYMTATPRIYKRSSKRTVRRLNLDVVDMGDIGVYGPELHHLPFAKAVRRGRLSDYRVIVLGVGKGGVTPALRRRLEALDEPEAWKRGRAPTPRDMARVLGVSLAVNGVTEGTDFERPGKLTRTLAFSNSIRRSKWYAKALGESRVLSATTRRMKDGRAMKVVAKHLDASSSALERNLELRLLAQADREGECRIVCNVKLFTEGVDVPQLDAVAFLDPRDSHVDVVQAVGRVMRKAPGKRFGYIVIPVVVEPGSDIFEALEQGTEGYKTVGRVLRALQAHDGRLAKEFATFVQVYESTGGDGGGGPGGEIDDDQFVLGLKEAEQGIFTHVAAASGLGKPGQLVADEIADAVRYVSSVFRDQELEDGLAEALELVTEHDGGAKGVCTIAALMLANACLLQRRLRDEPQMTMILRLDKVAGASDPTEVLAIAWESILEKDYAPVFTPALAVLEALPKANRVVGDAVRVLAECANRVADSLSELGYDHAGPLYHRILGSAKSDGAFYTNNLSAIMLARLALSRDMIDWSDLDAVGELRIMDPACGTGSLLMACIQTIKARVADATGDAMSKAERNSLHRRIVEDVLCGLDINQHGVQLAACNMTLGAPTVDYKRMNLVTMPHGPQPDGSMKAGSLEILTATDAHDLSAITAPRRSLEALDGDQVDSSTEIRFPLQNLDGVIMNAPFTDNRKRSRKFSPEAVKRMQLHELGIRGALQHRDPEAGGVITSNSIRTFFTPLAEAMLRPEVQAEFRRSSGGVQAEFRRSSGGVQAEFRRSSGGVQAEFRRSSGGVQAEFRNSTFLAKVLPVTACTGASGLAERRFLAERFHVERIVTTHDPKKIAFSENTSIHESLLICRRRPPRECPPTEFVSLRKMPRSAEEAAQVADAIAGGRVGDWGSAVSWPADRVRNGDWTPAQWFDGGLAETVREIEASPLLEPVGLRRRVGPAGQRIQDAYVRCEPDVAGALPGFHSVSAKIRRTMLAEPDAWYRAKAEKERLAARYAAQRSRFLVATRMDTVSGRLNGLWASVPGFGYWVPITVEDNREGLALAAWWNSTPARMILMNKRSRKLTYPKWSLTQLREVRIPKPDNPAWGLLANAWEQACNLEFLPMGDAERCAARKIVDSAAAAVLGVSEEAIAGWRTRLAAEPTISNKAAAKAGEDEDSA